MAVAGRWIIMAAVLASVTGAHLEAKSANRDKAAEATRRATAEKYLDQARGWEKLSNEARAAGKVELADAYFRCAAARRKIAQGITNDDRPLAEAGVKDFTAARDTAEKLRRNAINPADAPATTAAPAAPTADTPRKNAANPESAGTALAGRHLRAAVELEQKASEAQQQGLSDLAAAYRKCAAARRRMAEGYASGNQDAVKLALAEYKAARAALTSTAGSRVEKRLTPRNPVKKAYTGSNTPEYKL